MRENMTKQDPFRFLVANTHIHDVHGGYVRRGTSRGFRFPNGFGASVVKNTSTIDGLPCGGSYGAEEGLYELAILSWHSEDESSIEYSTPITSDVLGWLSVAEVEETLQQIMDLWIVEGKQSTLSGVE